MATTLKLEWSQLDTLLAAIDGLPETDNERASEHRAELRRVVRDAERRAYQKRDIR